MTGQRWGEYSAVAGFTTVALGCLLTLSGAVPVHLPHFIARHVPQVATAAPAAQPVRPAAAGPAPAAADAPAQVDPRLAAQNRYYAALRSRLNWVRSRIGDSVFLTPDLASRMLLAKSAARRAHLEDVGLGFMDVYGIIAAETSWMPRAGASRDGTPNVGIAQFEPATARALGVADPNDPVEAVHAAAMHMKEAAIWSASRLHGLKLSAAERAEKLREGVSIYYNLSSRGRAAWNGRNTDKLPRETQLHILNARIGAREAAIAEAQLRASRYRDRHDEAVLTAGDAGAGS